MDKKILKLVLENAVKYDGKADLKSVLGKIFSLKKVRDKKKLINDVKKIIKKINSMKLEKQKQELEKLGGITKIKKKEKDIFEFLGIKKGQRVVTAFPPGPEKYPHIGHAKALILNYLLAKKYNGKFILRFEDTNPLFVKKEFYGIMLKDFKWLGVRWDKLQYASDNMALFYRLGKKLISDGEAYVCYCNQNEISENRRRGFECGHRSGGAKKHLIEWEKFFDAKAGSCFVRLKGNMEHLNTTMRDPALFRIIDEKHARQGGKYRVWPTYDFQNAVMDGYYKVTHRLRSKEFELRSELQRHIQKLLGLKVTQTYEFARFNIKGVSSSGRVIRDMINKKQLIGWDDPRLTTIVALRRRGITKEAITDFVISSGITKAESVLTWENLYVRNRRILDKKTNRYFFIYNGKKIKIKKAPKIKAKLPLHPDFPKRGYRIIETNNNFYVQDDLKKNKIYRFMHLFNFKNNEFVSKEYDSNLRAKLIHWLPTKGNVNVEILMDDGSIKKGLGEKGLSKLRIGEIIQFERFGFCRLDKKERNKLIFWFTHK